MHSCFCNAHLQKVTDKLWSRLQIFLSQNKGSIKVKNDTYSLPYETLLLLVLYRLSRPRHMRKEREGFFGLHKSKISTEITCIIHAMHALVLQYLDNPAIFHNRMPYYAERVYQKCGLVETVWGFIDGTLCKTYCPSLFQKLMYSGHKQCHGIKFQSVVTPDDLSASMYGLVSGNRHDSFLLSNSGLLNKLQEFMPDDATEDIEAVIYSLYGDPAYPQSIHIFCGYKNPADGSTQAHWNCQMSKVCEVVKWSFSNILAQWSFLDFRVAMKIFQSPVAKYYIVSALLVTIGTCFYGNQTMKYFNCETMSLDEYLSLIDE